MVRLDVGHENSTRTKELLKRCVKEKTAMRFGRFSSRYCSHVPRTENAKCWKRYIQTDTKCPYYLGYDL